jgi:hypothetical protein
MPVNEALQKQVISIAQTLLRSEPDETKRSPGLIAEKVAVAASLFPGGKDQVDQAAAVAELIRRFSHWIGSDGTLRDDKGHVDWLDASRKTDWRYWHRLQRYMERSLSVDVVDALDKSTDGILGLLEDPRREGSWDRRGLVVGHVQSGKTSSYSALICKAADAGYKIIIVLAGLHNNLRSQTQIRLEEAFLGYETSPNRDPGKPLGVFEEDSDPKIHPHCATTRAENGDFNTAVAKHFAISPEEKPWLFVIKKNKTVLGRLLKWIQGHHVADATDTATGRRIVTKLPLLVIDDEADNASVDTGEQAFNAEGVPDDDHQPTAINRLIRRILHSFAKSAYVGYTATPFANIFIHRRNETKEEGPDLFPRSFIKNLAAPSNYVGPARVFGLRGVNGRIGGLPLTRDISDHVNRDAPGGWMPPKHNKTHVPVYMGNEAVPPSVKEAVCSFVLACAARTCRGQGKAHSSMLVHVTRFTDVQVEVHRQIEELVRRMKQRINRRIDHEALVDELRSLWQRDFIPTSKVLALALPEQGGAPVMPSWDAVLEVLPVVLADIDVRIINGSALDTLDYVEHQSTGLKVIAIGGDKLARGLTLEGLCTSYFVRTTKMYDTLMQMGRWFGYRPGYLDLCRLYTTADLVEWFGHIADASEELREEFDAMVATGATPWDYGLKVESHPVLLVTSPMKMRSAQTLSLTYSGTFVQTIVFRSDIPALRQNLETADRLMTVIGDPDARSPIRNRGTMKPDRWDNSILWRNVPSDAVIEFLSGYITPRGSPRAHSRVLSEFVTKMNARGELLNWTVALVAQGQAGSGTPYTFAGRYEVSSFPKRSHKGDKDGPYTIGVLTDPSDEGIDIDEREWLEALEVTRKTWKPDPARNRVTEPVRPGGKPLRDVIARKQGHAARGLLLLYPLAPSGDNGAICDGWSKPIMAFAMSFPASEAGVVVEYEVDHLYWEQQFETSE